jgi:tetratricopeptide (TPR) repeat protein
MTGGDEYNVAEHLPFASLLAALAARTRAEPLWLSWLALALTGALGALAASASLPAAALALLLRSAIAPEPYDYAQCGQSALVLLAAGLLVWRARAPSRTRTALAVAGIGQTLLFRSSMAFFPPLLGLHEWLSARGRARSARRRDALILALAPYVFLLPWMAMNRLVNGRATAFERYQSDSNVVSGALGLVETVTGDWRRLVPPGIDAHDDSAVRAWAAREALGHPGRTLDAVRRRLSFVASFHPWLILAALAAVAAGRGSAELRTLGLLAAYYVLVHCLMSVQINYFTPAWFLLSALAAAAPSALLRPPAAARDESARRAAQAFLLAALAAAAAFGAFALAAAAAYPLRAAAPLPAALDRAIAADPGDDYLLAARGRLDLLAGERARAVEDYARAHDASRSPADALLRAWAAFLDGRPRSLLGWTVPSARAAGSPTLGPGGSLFFDAELLKGAALALAGREDEGRLGLASAEVKFRGRPAVGPSRTELTLRVADALQATHADFVRLCLARCVGLDVEQKRRLLRVLAAPDAEFAALESERRGARPRPSGVGPLLERVRLEADAGRRDRARADAVAAAPLAATPAERLQLARLFGRLGDQERRLALVQSAARGDAGPETSAELARAALAAGRLDLAVEAARKAEPLGRGDGAELAGLKADVAGALLAAGRRDEALSWAEAAAPRADDATLHRLALFDQEAGLYAKAAAILDGLVRRHPRSAEFLGDRGMCRQLGGDAAGAESDLRAAIALDPDAFPAYLTLSAVLEGQGRFRDAAAVCGRALARPPRAGEDELRSALSRAQVEASKRAEAAP